MDFWRNQGKPAEMYASAKTKNQSLVEIELDPPKTGSILPKCIKICDNLLQQFRFTLGQPKPLFRPKPKFHRTPNFGRAIPSFRSITKSLKTI